MSRKKKQFTEAEEAIKQAVQQLEVAEQQVETEPKGENMKETDQITILAHRIKNPALMEEVKQTGLYKFIVFRHEWRTIELEGGKKKKRKVKVFDGLGDFPDDKVAPMPKHSPLKEKVDAGLIRYARIAQIGQDGKWFKGQKYQSFECFQNAAAAAGYLCIQPDWKDAEVQVFYDTPERLAEFFGKSVEDIYKNIGKLHKWLKLIKTPSKVVIDDSQKDMKMNVLYVQDEQTPLGQDQFDGDVWCKHQLQVMKPSGGATWHGFTELMQWRTFIESGMLDKGLMAFHFTRFLRKAKQIRARLPHIDPKKIDVIVNQHSVKFDNLGLKDGDIVEVAAGELFRFINARFKAGTSTLGAQLVAMSNMVIARAILEEKNILDSALLLKALAKGMPYAWMHIAGGYKRLNTNSFIELAFAIKRPEYGWRMTKMPTLHNRRISFLESEWRKQISSVRVNTESRYAYTDERCDYATLEWHKHTGEWVSFVVVDQDTVLNSHGEVATIKYPLHSSPCIASHRALRADLWQEDSPLIYGPRGGLGFGTFYQRSVKGLDCDGDKLAMFATEVHIAVEFDLKEIEEAKDVKLAPPADLAEAVAHTLDLAKKGEADTRAIGYIDLAIRYAFTSAHMNNVKITPELSAAVGELREGGIKGGIKGAEGLKGIAATGKHLDVVASLEAGTLTEDVLDWFADHSGHRAPALSSPSELNTNNLAEIIHFLVVKNAGCKSRSHADKFLHRMNVLLPAYMAHPGDKSNNPWHNPFVALADGIKPEYLVADIQDCAVHQKEYKACWNLVQASFATYGPAGLGYDFDLDMVKGFSEWLREFYRYNSNNILNDFRGITDSETGEVLRQGDFDADRRGRRYMRLNRVVRFLLNGLEPHPADLEQIPQGIIPDTVLARSKWFADFPEQSAKYLMFAHIYIGTIDINTKGKKGNSGGVMHYFPASVIYEARAFYYDKTPQGQKEERNPWLDTCRDLAVQFDEEWIKRSLEWLEKRPYDDEFIHPESDEEGFEEDEIAEDFLNDLDADESFDSID